MCCARFFLDIFICTIIVTNLTHNIFLLSVFLGWNKYKRNTARWDVEEADFLLSWQRLLDKIKELLRNIAIANTYVFIVLFLDFISPVLCAEKHKIKGHALILLCTTNRKCICNEDCFKVRPWPTANFLASATLWKGTAWWTAWPHDIVILPRS